MRATPGRPRGGARGGAGHGAPGVLAAVLGLIAACGPPPAAAPPPRDLDAEARGAATTFVHCYERDGAECRHRDAPYRAWQALRTLVAVRDHSPVVLLQELPRALERLRDDTAARKDFIAQLIAREPVARVGLCEAAAVRPLAGAITAVVAAARGRVEALALGDTPLGGRVGELGEAARELRETREVRLACAGGRALFLVVAPTPDGAWHPVELADAPVAVAPSRAAAVAPAVIPVAGSEIIDPWLPFTEDQL